MNMDNFINLNEILECMDITIDTTHTLGRNSTLKPDVPEFIPKQLVNRNGLHTTMGNMLSEHNIMLTEGASAIQSYTDAEEVGQINHAIPEYSSSSTQTCLLDNTEINKTNMDSDDLKLIAVKLLENEYLQEKIKALEEQLKAQQEETKESDRKQIKLEVLLEEIQKSQIKLECANDRNQRRIKYLESSLMEQCTKFLSLEMHKTAKHISKCNNMLADLKLALHYLTPSSAPSIEECQRSIQEWETQLRIERNYLQAVEEYSRSIFIALQNDDTLPYLNQPHTHTDINDLRDILHDNYVPTITYFITKQKQPQPGTSMMFPITSPVWYPKYHQPPQSQSVVIPRANNNSIMEGVPVYLHQPTQPRMNYTSSSKNLVTNQSEELLIGDGNINIHSKKREEGVIIETVEDTEFEEKCDVDIVDLLNVKIEEISVDEKDKNVNQQQDKSLPQNCAEEDISTKKRDEVMVEVNTYTTDISNKENDNGEEFLPAISKIQEVTKSEEIVVIKESRGEADSKLAIINEPGKTKEIIQLPPPITATGRPKFNNLFVFVKQRIPDVTDEKLLSAIKRVRGKKEKLSGMTKESILAAVTEELQNTHGYYSNLNQQLDQCAICLFPYEQSTKTLLKCEHSFHDECIKTWFKTNSICPICRLHAVPDEDMECK